MTHAGPPPGTSGGGRGRPAFGGRSVADLPAVRVELLVQGLLLRLGDIAAVGFRIGALLHPQ